MISQKKHQVEISQNHSRNYKKENEFYAKKPSGEWRKGDETLYTENENLKNLKNSYYNHGKIFVKLESKNKIEEAIYPRWWTTEKNPSKNNNTEHQLNLNDHENRVQNMKTNQYRRRSFKDKSNHRYRYQNNSNFRSISSKTYSPATTEVYISRTPHIMPIFKRQRPKSNKNLKIKPSSCSYSKLHKRNPYLYLEWGNNDEFNSNIKNAESKIKSQVIYDRLMYKSSKHQKEIINSSEEWKYDKNNNSQYNNVSETNTPERRGLKKNYMISYDKSLKPEVIREKSKEKNHSKPSRRESEINKKNENESIENKKPSEPLNVSNFPQIETVETAKFPPDHQPVENINIQSGMSQNYNENEYLSSYAPSERTKRIFSLILVYFQREFHKDSPREYNFENEYNQLNNINSEKNFKPYPSENEKMKTENQKYYETKYENYNIGRANKNDVKVSSLKERYDNNNYDDNYDNNYINYNRNYNTHSFHPYYDKNQV
jgi:hypothetical protein